MNVFVFGTLLHVPLLQVVSGREDIEDRMVWAVRPGHAVSRVQGQVFPMIHAQAGAVAEGVVLTGLEEADLRRLDYYEKAFGYDRTELIVSGADGEDMTAAAYVPEPDRWQPAEPWDREAWMAKWGRVTTETAKEAMDVMDHMAASEMGQRYGQMMSRAASRIRARDAHPKLGKFGESDVRVTARRRPYTSFFSVEELDLSFKKFDGSMSGVVERGVFVGGDSAIVLPYDPVRDRVLLIEQFRAGAFGRGDPNPWTVEPIAGRIDPGEEPAQAAKREALEEAGIILRDLKCVSAAYPSPGTTTEHFYVYVGLCDLPDDVGGTGGEAGEDEDIRSHVLSWTEFDAGLNAGEYRILPLIVAGQWLARHRAGLRSSA